MTDSHEKYGPRTAVVERVIERARRLSDDEAHALIDAWFARADTYDWAVAWHAVAQELMDTAFAAWVAAGDAAEEAALAVGNAVKLATEEAVLAAALADLAGEQGLTREHLETLAGPWRQVITDVDPLEQ